MSWETCGSYFKLSRHRMVKSIGTLASESLGVRKRQFFRPDEPPGDIRREVHALGSALRKQRSLVSPPLRLELQCEGRHPQRAGFASPHAEGEGLSGVTSDRETFAFISAPAGVVGGVPVRRARNPWAMPAAST